MGAFDGELAALGYGSSKTTGRCIHKPAETFYVSWTGCDGIGLTGKHHASLKEAEARFREKFHEGLKPSRWYDIGSSQGEEQW